MYTHELFDIELANKSLDEVKDVMTDVPPGGISQLDEFKRDYKAETGENVPLSDDEVIFMMAGLDDSQDMDTYKAIMATRVTGDEEDGDTPKTDEEIAQEAEQEQIVVDRQTANTLTKGAMEFAKKYLTKGIMGQMFEIQYADEKSKKGIAIMLVDRLLGENKWTPETWDLLPDPNISTKEAKALQQKGTNILLPRFSYRDGNRPRVADWYEIAVRATPQGMEIVKELEDIEIGGSDVKGKTENQQKWERSGKEARDRRAATLTKRLSNIVNRWKRFVKLKLLMDAINELHKTVHCELLVRTDADGEIMQPASLTDDADCLVVWKLNSKGDRLKNESFIPNTFMRLDPKAVDDALVKKHGGYWEALMDTKNREPKDKKGYDVPAGGEAYVAFQNTLQEFYRDDASLLMFSKFWASIKDAQEKKEIAETLEEVYIKQSNFFNVTRRFLEESRAAEEAAKAEKRLAKAG